MPPRTRSQHAAQSALSERSQPSRFASRTAFDALKIEGDDDESSNDDSASESQVESQDEGRPHVQPGSNKASALKRISSNNESESAAESLAPTGSTLLTEPSVAVPGLPVAPQSQQSPGLADAQATMLGHPEQGRTSTSTELDDQDPYHVHAQAEAVAEASQHSDRDAPATARASASSTVYGPKGNGKTIESTDQVDTTVDAGARASSSSGATDGLTARAHAQASVDATGATDQEELKKVQPDGSSQNPTTDKSESVTNQAQSDAEAYAQKQAENKIWRKKVYERTIFTFAMIGGFIALLLMGHPYMILLVTLLATLVYREIVGLVNLTERRSLELDTDGSEESKAVVEQQRKDALWNKTMSWYFFVVANCFLYGESLVYYFKHIVYEEVYFVRFAKNHRLLSLMLYVFGFMAFILNLRRDNLQHQFGLFSWIHMTLFLIVLSSHFMVNSILEGMIWFWVPASLIICNDIFAYVCGMLFGRTPLISLSPKKTREGFFGAFIITVIFSYFWGSLFQRYNYMICPAVSLGENAWSQMQCEPNHVFVWHYAQLPTIVSNLLTPILSPLTGTTVTHVPYTMFQWHSVVMASFASLVAPFGGFFASGFKRAFKIKDFGDSIPGHGGLTDRFDCQFLMGLWAYTYYASLIREHHTTVGAVLQVAVTQLKPEEIHELYTDLRHYLRGQGAL